MAPSEVWKIIPMITTLVTGCIVLVIRSLRRQFWPGWARSKKPDVLSGTQAEFD